MKKRGQEFKRKHRGVYQRVWREEGKEEVMSLYYNLPHIHKVRGQPVNSHKIQKSYL